MGQVVEFPLDRKATRYGERLHTLGEPWVNQEKKLVDRAEFLEAMILVLDDVRLQNIRSRDFAMMEVVAEEIPLYQRRLDEVKQSLAKLRGEFRQQTVHGAR